MGTLYKLDFPDGKAYIGITTKSVEHRFKAHACNARTGRRARLYAAWRKHGAPRLTVLAILEDRELASTEIRAIAAYGTLAPNGYNMTPGGDLSPMDSAEVVAKMIQTKRSNGSFFSITEEGKRRLSEAHKGNKYTEGYKHTEEWKLAASARLIGNTNAKGGRGNLGKKRSPEQVEAMRAARKGVSLSEATKAKMKLAQQARRAAEKGEK